jgi:clan AA aspartic protease
MGLVYADITIYNNDDFALVRKNQLDPEDVKKIDVRALVDTGSYMLCINEVIQEQLQLHIVEKRKAETADGRILEMEVVECLITFRNRRCVCSAMVLPGDSEVLLGAIPLEDMDVLIHPQRQELIINPEHPYFAQMKLK